MGTFKEVLDSAFFSKGYNEEHEGIKQFTSGLERAVNTFTTAGVRAEAREYGEVNPRKMMLICLAWTDAMNSAYEERCYDDRNRLACERCHKFISHVESKDLLRTETENEFYVTLVKWLKRYTLVHMHRTNIQTATQVLWEGMLAAVNGTDAGRVVNETCQGDTFFYTRMPMI